MRHALVRLATGEVEAVLEVPRGSWSRAVPGFVVLQDDAVVVGDLWDGEKFTTPEAPEPDQPMADHPAPVLIAPPTLEDRQAGTFDLVMLRPARGEDPPAE